MHVIVCVKQVPDTTNVRINPKTNTLMREGVESIINPFDEFALEQGLKLKDELGARLSVISMGPPQATIVLQEAMARGADDCYLLSDRAFAGADTLATSYAIATAIKKIDPHPDLVLFGKQAIDGDTAQVGPGVSEFLGASLVTYARSIKVTGDTFTVESLMDAGVDVIEGKFPAVVTVVKEGVVPRFPLLSKWVEAKHAKITVWGALQEGADLAKCGLNGSPTKVVRIFPPPTKTGGEKFDARRDFDGAIKKMMALMASKGVA